MNDDIPGFEEWYDKLCAAALQKDAHKVGICLKKITMGAMLSAGHNPDEGVPLIHDAVKFYCVIMGQFVGRMVKKYNLPMTPESVKYGQNWRMN